MERLESQLELLFNYQEAFNIPSNIAAEAIDSLENIQQCLSSYKEDAAKLWNFYRLGIICLQQFVVANFIGPAVTEGLKLFGSISTDQIDKKLDTLESSDIKIAPTCTNQELLAVAKLILVDNCPEGTRLFGSLDWWACRCLWIQQQVLTERSKVIKADLQSHSAKAFSWLKELELASQPKLTVASYQTVLALFKIESAYHLLGYFEVKLAQEEIAEAVKLRQLNLQLTGKLGRRTNFQTFDVAQLTLSSSDSFEIEKPDVSENVGLFGVIGRHVTPVNCRLQHETLLESVKITDTEAETVTITNGIDQCLVIALVSYLKRANPMHELMKEELSVYLQKVLESPKVWCVQTAGLNLRCLLELEDTKRFERALAQLEELITQFSREKPTSMDRFALAWCCNVSPIWVIQKTLAELLKKLGCVSEALKIFEGLQMWDEVVKCYKVMQKKEQAEALVRELLETRGETPELLIALGDLTLNVEYYQRAWEVSKHRSAKAQSSMGMLYFVRNQFDKAAEALKISVDILPLQVDPWFALGYCAMQIENYQLSAQAYHRCVNIEPDNYEAWNNLSASYIHLKQKDRAFKLLQEALKYNFENWKIWENFLLVSVDTGHIKEAIEASHRLLDLKEKWADTEVLGILVKAVLDEKLQAELQKLFGRLTALVPNNEDIWALYAQACVPLSETANNFADNMEKHIRFLQKAYQIGSQKSGWERVEESRSKLLKIFTSYTEAVLKMIATGQDKKLVEGFRSSARLGAKSLSAKLKLVSDQTLDPSHVSAIEAQMANVKELLRRLEEVE